MPPANKRPVLYGAMIYGAVIRFCCPRVSVGYEVPPSLHRPAPGDRHCVYATYGLGIGVHCQRLNGGSIGIQSIIDAGLIDAADIWGCAEQHIEVCFPQSVRLLFLEARTIPRAILSLAAYIVNGMICGGIDSPGSIVLMSNP